MTDQTLTPAEIHILIGELRAVAELYNEPDAARAADVMQQMLGLLVSAANRIQAVAFLVEACRQSDDFDDDDGAVPVGDLRDALDGDFIVARAG